jgi:hypothetical protein
MFSAQNFAPEEKMTLLHDRADSILTGDCRETPFDRFRPQPIYDLRSEPPWERAPKKGLTGRVLSNIFPNKNVLKYADEKFLNYMKSVLNKKIKK